MKWLVLKFVIIVFILLTNSLQAYTVLKYGPVHEAYMTKELGALVLYAVPDAPPPSINEIIPKQTDPKTQWISGYWAWNESLGKYIWITGIWRRPPPGHSWTEGYWKRYIQGWVWIQGFWSNVQSDDLNYIAVPPMQREEDNVPPPPDSDFFWVEGSWIYDREKNEYQWYKGTWQRLDPNWMLIPSHYYWRPGGYVFIPNYWDWSNATRGIVYASIEVDLEDISDLRFEPTDVVDQFDIMLTYFPFYPNYMGHYIHHYYYFNTFWKAQRIIPPWWQWQTWWSFTHYNQWALWWWYTHPGYTAPVWLTEEMAKEIPPPYENTLLSVANSVIPPVVSKFGVIDQTQVIQVLVNRLGRKDLIAPILPPNAQEVDEIKDEAGRSNNAKENFLKPSGLRSAESLVPFIKNAPAKPLFENDNSSKTNRVVPIPNKPIEGFLGYLAQNVNVPSHYGNRPNPYRIGPHPYRNEPPLYGNGNGSNPRDPPPPPAEVENYNFNPMSTQPITPTPPTQSNEVKVPSLPAFDTPIPKMEEFPCMPPHLQVPPPQVPSINEDEIRLYPLPRAQQDEGFLMNRSQPQVNPGISPHNTRGLRPKDRNYKYFYP